MCTWGIDIATQHATPATHSSACSAAGDNWQPVAITSGCAAKNPHCTAFAYMPLLHAPLTITSSPLELRLIGSMSAETVFRTYVRQIGIGGMPNAVCSLLCESSVRDLGVHVTCLHEGSVLAEGSIDQVSQNDRVVEVYLGR